MNTVAYTLKTLHKSGLMRILQVVNGDVRSLLSGHQLAFSSCAEKWFCELPQNFFFGSNGGGCCQFPFLPERLGNLIIAAVVPFQYLNTVIPYEKKGAPPSVEDLQMLTNSKLVVCYVECSEAQH